MKHILRTALLLAPLAGSSAADGPVVYPPKLNVLLIMADDLRAYGGAFARDMLKTPNPDRLRVFTDIRMKSYLA